MSDAEKIVCIEELMGAPPRADTVVASWSDRMTSKARRAMRIIRYALSAPMLIVGAILAALVDGELVMRIELAFVPWLVIALPIKLLFRYHYRWNMEQALRFVRDGVAHTARVVGRWYTSGGLAGIRVMWSDGGREVVARVELSERDIDETTEHVTVLAISGDPYVTAIVGQEALAIGRVKRRRRLWGGDSGAGASPGMPTARVVTPRKSHDS